MSPQDEALLALCEAVEVATPPGEWLYNDPDHFTQHHGKFSETAVYAPGNAHHWRMCEIQASSEQAEIAIAKFIAAAREHLPRLLRENARLREVLIDVAASLAASISLLERGGKAAKKAAPSDNMFDQMLVDYRQSLERARAVYSELAP